jgi:thiol-disulfide isomerase/thioredoxin
MISLTFRDFSGTALLDPRSVLTLFYADWCPFCRSFLTIFESAMVKSAEPLGALVNISDENNPLWETFKVDIVPTLVGFRDGLVKVRKDGVASIGLGMPELEDALQKMEKR